MEALEESNIQIAILSAYESHNQTPHPDSNSSFDLKWCAMRDEWSLEVENFVRNNPDSVRSPLNERGDTALHVAVDAWSITFMENLVELMRPEELLIQNNDGKVPLYLAVSTGQRTMTKLLLSEQVVDKITFEDIKPLFFMAITNEMFDVAMELFKKYPAILAAARSEENFTALQMLGRYDDISFLPIYDYLLYTNYNDLFKGLWNEVVKLKDGEILELITKPSAVLTDLTKSRNTWAVRWLLDEHRALVTKIKDPKSGKNLLHLLVQYRWPDIFPRGHPEYNLLEEAVDKEGNNVLHMAGHLESSELSSLRAYNQMEKDFTYFKRVITKLPYELRIMKNKKGKRPLDVFIDQHKNLSEEIKGAVKGIAESGMLVAALVATVAFAASLTVPGDKTNVWFIIFILTNAVALFASCGSILSFLSNYTSSRFAKSEFVIVLHPSLTFGLTLLIISVAVMVVAFTAALFLIFDHTTKWVSYVVTSMGVFPLLLFLLFHFNFNFFDDLIWAKYYHPFLA